MDYSYLIKIMNKNWFQQIDEKHQREWSFREDVEEMTDSQLKALVTLLIRSFESDRSFESEKALDEIDKITKGLRMEGYLERDEYIMNIDLEYTINIDLIVKFLHCITLAEYQMDNILYYPHDLRSRAIDQISESVGLDAKTIRKIYVNWHSSIRNDVFSE